MIVYFDTSALVKRYVVEAGSDAVTALWNNSQPPASSWLLYAETTAAFARRRRERSAPVAEIDNAHRLFRNDWLRFHRIPIDDEVNALVDALLARHPLRGGDAVHLASALHLRELAQDDVTFACADIALNAAARAEGLAVSP